MDWLNEYAPLLAFIFMVFTSISSGFLIWLIVPFRKYLKKRDEISDKALRCCYSYKDNYQLLQSSYYSLLSDIATGKIDNFQILKEYAINCLNARDELHTKLKSESLKD